METVSTRIKKALDLRGMKQSDLVEKTGIGKSSISTYLSGDYEPKQRNIYKMAKALNVSESWLMGNDVPMERDFFASETPKILQDYEKLNDNGKIEAEKRVEELTYIPRYTKEIPDYLTLKAAHAIEGASEEDKKHDYDIMNDKNF